MGEFMNELRISGYFISYRHQMLKGILARQKQIETEVANGDRIKYRNREQILSQKKNSLGNYPDTWFLKKNIRNTLKVQATPGQKLADKLNNCMAKRNNPNGGTKVIEMASDKITKGMTSSENWGIQGQCNYNKKCNTDENDC